MVYVNDRDAFASFCNDPNNSSFANSSGSLFQTGSTWDNTYIAVRDNLIDNGYSQNDAQSYVLDHYDTGMKIYKKQSGTYDFKEQKTEQSSTNYSPKICN